MVNVTRFNLVMLAEAHPISCQSTGVQRENPHAIGELQTLAT